MRDHFIEAVGTVLLSIAPPFAGNALSVAAAVLLSRRASDGRAVGTFIRSVAAINIPIAVPPLLDALAVGASKLIIRAARICHQSRTKKIPSNSLINRQSTVIRRRRCPKLMAPFNSVQFDDDIGSAASGLRKSHQNVCRAKCLVTPARMNRWRASLN